MNIYSANLNLLVAFDALMQERSVTRAAQRLGLSQSAASNALAQLRVLFDDPLFVRTRYGIEPTLRATELAASVRSGLSQLDAALGGRTGFDPEESDRVFVIAADDYVEYVLLPPLMKRLSKDAPKLRIELRHWGLHHVPEGLRTGAFDLMIGYYQDVPAHHHHKKLFRETYACIVRRGHPRVKKRLTMKAYADLAHILVSQQGDAKGDVDVELAKHGLSRRIGLRASHFLMVPPLVAETDMVAAISRRVALPFAKLLPLRVFEPPLPLPVARVGHVWHARHHEDPGHAWLRRTIEEVCETL